MKPEILNTILDDATLSTESREKLKALHDIISEKEFSDLLDANGRD
ncbi:MULTISPECIES: hypothetical protein [unclassified Chryseobacterium]|nr:MULTISPECIES: hypothetical protein [unclassified Chryseobacterium]